MFVIKKVCTIGTIILMLILTMPQLEAKPKVKLSKANITIYLKEQSPKITLKGISKKNLKKVKWKSSNKKVATVKNGKITTKKAGKTTITAIYKNKKYKCKVTVKNININKKQINLINDQIYTLKLKGVLKKNQKKILWKSVNPQIAIVDKNGNVIGKKTGTTQIIAQYKKKKYKCKVNVVIEEKPTPPEEPVHVHEFIDFVCECGAIDEESIIKGNSIYNIKYKFVDENNNAYPATINIDDEIIKTNGEYSYIQYAPSEPNVKLSDYDYKIKTISKSQSTNSKTNIVTYNIEYQYTLHKFNLSNMCEVCKLINTNITNPTHITKYTYKLVDENKNPVSGTIVIDNEVISVPQTGISFSLYSTTDQIKEILVLGEIFPSDITKETILYSNKLNENGLYESSIEKLVEIIIKKDID